MLVALTTISVVAVGFAFARLTQNRRSDALIGLGVILHIAGAA